MSFWKDRRPLDRFRVVLIIAASVLAATVAGLAFWVSFEAISAYVVRIKAFPDNLRWAAPLLVDSFTLLGTAFLLWLALSGQRLRTVFDHWYAWALVVIATAASAYLNYMHVPTDAPHEAAWVAGAVPVTLLASVHLLVLLLLRLLAWTPTSEAGGRRPRQGQERGAGPTTTPPAPAAKSAAAPARSGVAPTAPERVTKSTDRSAERTRLIRSQLAEDINRSTRQIKTALGSAGPGMVGDSKALAAQVEEIRSEMKQESNGAPERVEVLS